MTSVGLRWEELLMPLLQKYKLNITWGDQDLLNIIFHHNPGESALSNSFKSMINNKRHVLMSFSSFFGECCHYFHIQDLISVLLCIKKQWKSKAIGIFFLLDLRLGSLKITSIVTYDRFCKTAFLTQALSLFLRPSLECLLEFPCQWNYRPDHCIYGSNCESAEEEGVHILHGNRGVYHDGKQPAFRAVYEAIRKVCILKCVGTKPRHHSYTPLIFEKKDLTWWDMWISQPFPLKEEKSLSKTARKTWKLWTLNTQSVLGVVSDERSRF